PRTANPRRKANSTAAALGMSQARPPPTFVNSRSERNHGNRRVPLAILERSQRRGTIIEFCLRNRPSPWRGRLLTLPDGFHPVSDRPGSGIEPTRRLALRSPNPTRAGWLAEGRAVRQRIVVEGRAL